MSIVSDLNGVLICRSNVKALNIFGVPKKKTDLDTVTIILTVRISLKKINCFV